MGLNALVCFALFDWDWCSHGVSLFCACVVDEQQLPPGSPQLCAKSLRDAVMQFSAKPRDAKAAVEFLSSELSCSSTCPPSIVLTRKHLNIMDPLLPGNNLGRSVSRSSYYRIKTAFSQGATLLTQVLQNEPIVASQKISSFFQSTWSMSQRVDLRLLNGTSLPEYFMMPQHRRRVSVTAADRYHHRKTSIDFISPRLERGQGSSLSLPDLSSGGMGNEKCEVGQNRNEDSMETHPDETFHEDSGALLEVTRPSRSAELPLNIEADFRQSSTDMEARVTKVDVSQIDTKDSESIRSGNSVRSGCAQGTIRHRRSESMSSQTIAIAPQPFYHIGSQMKAINFGRPQAPGGRIDCYSSDMRKLMEDIAVARRCQPSSPKRSIQNPAIRKVTSSVPGEMATKSNRRATDESKSETKEDVSSVREEQNENFAAQRKLAPVRISAPGGTAAAQTITYASVTAHGLTPKTRSCPLSRLGSMSVNPSLNNSSGSEGDEEDEENGSKDQSKQSDRGESSGITNKLTMKAVQDHLKENESIENTSNQVDKLLDLSGCVGRGLHEPIDVQSLSNKLQTWSLVARQPPGGHHLKSEGGDKNSVVGKCSTRMGSRPDEKTQSASPRSSCAQPQTKKGASWAAMVLHSPTHSSPR